MSILHAVGVGSAFAGIILSVTFMSKLIKDEFEHNVHQALSLVGAKNAITLKRFRWILYGCGSLITVGMLLAVAPYTNHQLVLSITWLFVCAGEFGAAHVPAVPGTKLTVHTIFANSMAVGFLVTASIFARILPAPYNVFELILTGVMLVLAFFCTIHKNRFIYYQVPFIFLSHITIAVAVVALY